MKERLGRDKRNTGGRNYWQESWKDGGIQEFPLHSSVIEEIKWHYLLEDLGPRSGRSLEVGCGSGHVSSLLAANGFRTYLLDYSTSAISCARNSFVQIGGRDRKAYLVGNALSLPYCENTFDLVLSCGVLEHFERPEAVIAEMARVLRPGGLFYSDVWPDRFSSLRMIERLHSRPQGWYENRMGARTIRALLAGAGLQVVRLFAAGVMPPRCIPGTGHFRALARIENAVVRGMRRFWRSLDNTVVANLFGSYYYATAVKPQEGGSVAH